MDFPESEMVEIRDGNKKVRLEVYEAGKGQEITVVLAHGWPELAYSWRHQIPALVEAGYRVVAPNQRGYGRSDKPEDVSSYDIHHLCSDHAGLLDALDIDKAVYVGHDWGAIVVWNHALLYPERMLGLANLSVPFTPRPAADPVAFWEQMLGPDFYIVHFNRQPGVAARAFEKNIDVFLRNMYRTNHWKKTAGFGESGKGILQMSEAIIEGGELMMSTEELKVFVEAFEKGGFVAPCNWYRNFTRNWETTEDVEQIVSMPSLMVYGEYDMVPKSKDMGDYVSDLEVQTLDCGHWIQQERPEQTNRILLDWLERKIKPLV